MIERSWFRKISMYLIVFGITLSLAGCPGGELSQDIPNQNPKGNNLNPNTFSKLESGTIIDKELDLSGLTPAEALIRIQQWQESKLEQTVNLVYNNTEIPFTFRELGVFLDSEETWNRVKDNQGKSIFSALKVDRLKANLVLNDRLSQFTRPAKDATFKIENDNFVVSPASPGLAIATDPIVSSIEGKSFQDIPSTLKLPLIEVPAAVTTEFITNYGFNGVIGEFTTKFNIKEVNRTYNLTEAAQKLDKKVIKPGEIFSFNDTIGPRTAETGFKDAYIIKNNEFIQGIGGGICQVSSTLYNSVLLANLQVVERYPHAVTISYVPLGQDATVNYPTLDFKFKNDTESIIYLRTLVKAGSLTMKIFGKKTQKAVRIEHEIEKEINFKVEKRINPELEPGKVKLEQPGSKGYRVKIFKYIKNSDGNETRQLISTDTYAPSNRIYSLGAD